MLKLKSIATFLPFSQTAYPDGVNLVGYIRGEFGLGQSCRLVAASLQESGVDFTIYNYELVSAKRFRDRSWEQKISDSPIYNINLFHINPFDLPIAFFQMDRKIWDQRYNIAFWLWELEELPEQWKNALDLIDEIWTPSAFVSDAFQKATQKPVRTIPYGLSTPDCGSYGRDFFNFPYDKFLFLCMYDTGSTIERKNPLGVIDAYKQAFSQEEQNIGLVIKINNPHPKDMQTIRDRLSGYTSIYTIYETLEQTQVNALIACVDVYISLHRAEGFGLVPAEAMLLGTPVIATNWSANTEFMTKETACLVDYQFVTIEESYGPYEAGNRWAEPDIKQAAGFMRKLYEDEDFRQGIAADAKKHIEVKLAPECAADKIRNRIKEIYQA